LPNTPGFIPSPDFVFITVTQALPRWVVGVVLAAITLSGLVLLSSVCLAISPLVTRNVVAGLDEAAQQRWAHVITGLYLALSIVGMAYAGTLIVTLNNLFYFGIVQFLPGFAAALCLSRIGAGCCRRHVCRVGHGFRPVWGRVDTGGINAGLIGLALNAGVMLALGRAFPRQGGAAFRNACAGRAGGSKTRPHRLYPFIQKIHHRAQARLVLMIGMEDEPVAAFLFKFFQTRRNRPRDRRDRWGTIPARPPPAPPASAP
jgi:hypothetical protein